MTATWHNNDNTTTDNVTFTTCDKVQPRLRSGRKYNKRCKIT